MICCNCNRSMKCIKTGQLVVFDEDVVKSGDIFLCPSCNCSVIDRVAAPFGVTDAFNELTKRGAEPIDMRTKKESK